MKRNNADSSKTSRLQVIADDLTGALDTGVQFFRCGFSVRFSMRAFLEGEAVCDVLAIDAESRHHDQGHIPLKLLGFVYDREAQKWQTVSGVNITLGLPVIRVSVDHGTAFDQAGLGTASELSLKNAIAYAVRFANARQTEKHRK